MDVTTADSDSDTTTGDGTDSGDGTTRSMPSMARLNVDGSRSLLVVMADSAFTSGGEKVPLGEGRTATVSFAVDADAFEAGDEIDIYAYDLHAGGWRLDGSATISEPGAGTAATFEAEHFTWRAVALAQPRLAAPRRRGAST